MWRLIGTAKSVETLEKQSNTLVTPSLTSACRKFTTVSQEGAQLQNPLNDCPMVALHDCGVAQVTCCGFAQVRCWQHRLSSSSCSCEVLAAQTSVQGVSYCGVANFSHLQWHCTTTPHSSRIWPVRPLAAFSYLASQHSAHRRNTGRNVQGHKVSCMPFTDMTKPPAAISADNQTWQTTKTTGETVTSATTKPLGNNTIISMFLP